MVENILMGTWSEVRGESIPNIARAADFRRVSGSADGRAKLTLP
jgi:hypothetical protein